MNYVRRTALAALALALVLGLVGAAPAAALDRELRLQILKAVVQLGPLVEFEKDGETEVRTMGWGSGTIISADGLILTNYHVVDVSDLQVPENAQAIEGKLAVYITTASDTPPTLSYIAEVVAGSPEMDLAVLRITTDIGGEAIDWDEVRLPYLELGDSGELEPGDSLYIFGYPGIGGETVTFTSGVVSGFTSEEGVGERAWIKTDAAISGGNSGGTAVSDDGTLVAVPTQVGRGGVGGTPEYVDCRPLADTNGDGRLDEQDACVPVGGFINALRPVALAAPLIEQALEGGTPSIQTPTKPNPSKEGVQVTGVILDADTGRPIPGALFLALQPGITYDAWESDDEVYSAAKADATGHFALPDLLQRGESYTLVAGLKGYEPVYEDGIEVGADADPVVDLTIKLQKQD